ncbi:MAG TPA: MMPL family transporter, partial [Solirubrobacteraceae bacterium]
MAIAPELSRTASRGADVDDYPHAANVGPIGRLGRYTATHFRVVLVAWILVAVVLGFFAPKVETALSGAGWETTGSQSVQARNLINKNFHGLSSYALMTVVYSPSQTVADRGFQQVLARVQSTLRSNGAVSSVVPPTPGISISRDRHTAIVQAGAARSSNGMVKAAESLKGRLHALSAGGVQVHLTGASGMWSDFNTANRNAMLKSEVISWPVTLGILLLAFGSLVAAGLPLMLTMVGLASAAGLLYLGTLVMPISIWAMNFALMFALALGIDYALFVVHRFRGALFGHRLSPVDATAVTMDTAGKAVLFSGITVLISLSAVMLVPSPAFRSMSLGIMFAVLFVLAATLTLLPAVLARIGPKVDNLALPWAHSGEHRSPRFAAWGERLWRQPVRYGVVALAILVGLALPVTQLKTAMPSIKVVPTTDSSYIGYQQVQRAFGPGSTGPLQIVAPARDAQPVARVAQADRGVAALMPTQRSAGYALITAIPKQDPSNPAVGSTIDRLRAKLPSGALIGGAVAENHDLQAALSAKTPLVIGVVLGLGFLLLLIALQAPLLAAVGVLTNLLATGAAFGVAKWVFQDGAAHSLLGFTPQGFLDAWGPVFFFAMIFAISMDYTV